MVRGAKDVIVNVPIGQIQTIDTLLDVGKRIYSITKNPADVSIPNLEASLGDYANIFILEKEYGEDQRKIKQEYGFDTIPLMALFRADVIRCPIENHPLIKARSVYENFQPSKHDWQRFTNLPTKIGIKEAELLGIFLADCIEEKAPRRPVVSLSGGHDHGRLYEKIISPGIKEVFNLPAPVRYCSSHVGTMLNFRDKLKSYSWKNPQISLCSGALKTWLNHDLGFPNLSNIIEYLPEKRQQLALIEGYIAGKGCCSDVAGQYTSRYRLHLCGNDEVFARELVKLARSLGIKTCGPYVTKEINKFQNEQMNCRISLHGQNLNDLHMLNPLHQEKLGRAC